MWFLAALTITLAAASARGQEQTHQPFFVEEPDNVTVIAGKKVLLKCVIANEGRSLVQWTFNDFGLGLDRRLSDWPHLRMVGANHDSDWNLEIDPVSIDDDGWYQCQRTPLRSRFAYVTVWVPPQDPFIEDGPVIRVKESVEVKLECVARGGKPPAKINWYDHHGNLVVDASYRSIRMRDSKLFEARSTVTFTPRRDHHNQTFRCEAWNEAGDNLRPALARLYVQYAPSVTVTPVRPGLVQEGDKASFRCTAEANPPVFESSYKWFLDNKEVPGHHGYYYDIFNVTRAHHDKQVRCAVENNLGVAMGLKSIEVKYGPTFLYHPRTTFGDRLEAITLHCIVDSNPPPQYYWTRDASREIIAHEQNITITIDESTVGSYYCHAETPGYSQITSRSAEVLMTGRPKISSSQSQDGIEGENVHINCVAISIPEAKSVVWTYHGSALDDTNSHYRIINSPIQHGVRSTLIIKQAISSDFGPYTCAIENSHGVSEILIELEQRKPFPLQIMLIAIFSGVILVLLVTILVILFRKRICSCCNRAEKDDKGPSATTDSSGLANNVILKVNNMDQMSNGSSSMKHRELTTPSQLSNEVDSAWEGSDNQDFRNNTTTQLFRHNSDLEPEFPPKPDVISTGYFPYAQYVRDYNPPPVLPGQESPMYSTCIPHHHTSTLPNNSKMAPGQRHSSLLNVTDPRYSATYGNPLLRQTPGPRGVQYSTFMPSPVAPPQVPLSVNTTFQPQVVPLGQYNNCHVSLPMSSRNQLHHQPVSGESPNNSLGSSNMACLPEDDHQSNNVTATRSLQNTPSPPPAPTPPMSTTAIYARVNPNLKRDKTNNNNFSNNTSSAFAPIMSDRTSFANPSIITNGCAQQPLQRPATSPKALNGGSLQRTLAMNGQQQQHELLSINSSVGTHV